MLGKAEKSLWLHAISCLHRAHSKSFNWNSCRRNSETIFFRFGFSRFQSRYRGSRTRSHSSRPTVASCRHVATDTRSTSVTSCKRTLEITGESHPASCSFHVLKFSAFLLLPSVVLPTTPWAALRSTWRSPDVRDPLSSIRLRGVNHLTATISHGRLTATRPWWKWDYSTEN